MERNIALDVLKLAMSFMVVGLHAGFLGDVSALGSYLTVQGIFRIAVPVFFVISGYYFYFAVEGNKHLLWIKRALVLYLVWMLLYAPVWFSALEISFSGGVNFLKTIIIGYYHLWYLSGLIGASILICFLRNYPPFLLTISILITFLAGVLIQYLGNYHFFEGQSLDKYLNFNWVHRNALFLAYPFFCCGYLINKLSLHLKVSVNHISMVVFVGVAMLVGESLFNYSNGQRHQGFDNLLSLIVLCPVIFLLFLKLDVTGKSKSIALYSSAIYFVHPAFLLLIVKYTSFGNTATSILILSLSGLASYFIVKLNHRLRFIL